MNQDKFNAEVNGNIHEIAGHLQTITDLLATIGDSIDKLTDTLSHALINGVNIKPDNTWKPQ